MLQCEDSQHKPQDKARWTQRHIKGTVAIDFKACFWPVWMLLGLNVNRFWLKICMMLLQFLEAILSFVTFHIKPSQRFYKSQRRIDN